MATQFNQPRTFGGAASKHRSERISFGPIRQRFMEFFRPAEADDQSDQPPVATPLDPPPKSADGALARFRIVRQGYDRLAVDAYIAELERDLTEMDHELAEMRGQALAADQVDRELKRIGEQTSAVLIAAHEQREEILRAAREEADRSVSAAAAQASALATEAQSQLRELEAKNEATHRQRDRLLNDVREVSAALAALVESAHERIAPQA